MYVFGFGHFNFVFYFLLIAPALLVWPVEAWEAGLPARIAGALLFVAIYASLAVGLRLLPASELRELRRTWHGVRT